MSPGEFVSPNQLCDSIGAGTLPPSRSRCSRGPVARGAGTGSPAGAVSPGPGGVGAQDTARISWDPVPEGTVQALSTRLGRRSSGRFLGCRPTRLLLVVPGEKKVVSPGEVSVEPEDALGSPGTWRGLSYSWHMGCVWLRWAPGTIVPAPRPSGWAGRGVSYQEAGCEVDGSPRAKGPLSVPRGLSSASRLLRENGLSGCVWPMSSSSPQT